MNKNDKKTGRNSGFTLIELLVAMGIVAVLTGMAAFNFNQSRVRARDVQRKSDISHLQKAMELFKNDSTTGSYPDEVGFQQSLIAGGYSKVVFNDPKEGAYSQYWYKPSADKKTYYLMACLENLTDQTKTTDTAICLNFRSSDGCACGWSSSADISGVMYTLSQP